MTRRYGGFGLRSGNICLKSAAQFLLRIGMLLLVRISGYNSPEGTTLEVTQGSLYVPFRASPELAELFHALSLRVKCRFPCCA